MQNIFKLDAVNSIRNIRITTERLARVMKKDSLNRKRDYNQISELNFRLKRVIPIIPLGLGAAGTIAGGMVSSGFPFIPKFRYFSPLKPPTKPPKGPGRKPDDKKPPGDEPQTSDATEPVPNPQPGQVELPETTQTPEVQEPVFPPLTAPPPVPEKESEREGAGVLEPALISEKLKEIYGEQLPEVFEAEPEIPQILPLEPIAPTEKEKELPPPLRFLQDLLNFTNLNEVAKGTTKYVQGQTPSQEKIREILDTISSDQKVAETIVQAFGLSTSLVPIIKTALTFVPVPGPAKVRKIFNVARFLFNSARQGNLSPARLRTLREDVSRYMRTGSFFRGVPDAQRIQSSRAIERQGAMRAQGVDRSSPAQTYQNIFGQSEFARRIQQALGDGFPNTFKPTQGKNMFDPEFPLAEFNVKDLGTIVPFDTPIPKFPTFTDKIFTRPLSIPKRTVGGEPVKVKPSRVRLEDQRREAGALETDTGDIYIPKNLTPAERKQLMDDIMSLQSSVPDTLIQPVIIIRGTAA